MAGWLYGLMDGWIKNPYWSSSRSELANTIYVSSSVLPRPHAPASPLVFSYQLREAGVRLLFH